MEIENRSSSRKRSATAVHKGVATRTRHDLNKQLRADLKAAKAALKAAGTAARAELKLARSAAKAEIAVLKDQLTAAGKREQALLKISEQKTKMMWKAGEQWEKEQVAKIQKAFK